MHQPRIHNIVLVSKTMQAHKIIIFAAYVRELWANLQGKLHLSSSLAESRSRLNVVNATWSVLW